MARILPVDRDAADKQTAAAFKRHSETYQARITNMKATLAHSLLSFEVYMQWYPLYNRVKEIVGNRMASLFAWSVSTASECPLCSTFFRKIIMDAGENPEDLQLTAAEQQLLDLGAVIAGNGGKVDDAVFNPVAARHTPEEMVVLIAFAGQMIATNIFNNVIETQIDPYLTDYIKPGV